MTEAAIAFDTASHTPRRRVGTPVRKHSIVLRGHKTSVSLEGPFWTEIKRMAREHGASLSAFVAEIDDRRGSGGLSTAIRIAVLQDLRRAAQLAPAVSPDDIDDCPTVYADEPEDAL